jgi:hypothetical protein
MLWQDTRIPLHRQKKELNLDSDIQVSRIAYEDRNAIPHNIMLVQHSNISLTSPKLITQLPYHLSTPHGLTPDNTSHNHMCTKVLYHTARVLPRSSVVLRLHGSLRPERHGPSSRGRGSHGSWIKHKYPAYQAPSILCHFQPPLTHS